MPKVKEKIENEIFSFYGGRIEIEKKKWGESFRYLRRDTGKGGMLSVTSCTKKLDKSDVLIKWAVGLVRTHITSTVEANKALTFSKDEVMLIVDEAVLKPEEGKVKGGQAGDIIHNFAHDFAKAKIAGTALPTIDHLDEKDEVQAKALNGINAFLDWYNSNKVEFIEMEKLTYYNSEIAGDEYVIDGKKVVIEYFGILDLFARVNGVLEVVDYKTSKGVYSDQRYQVSAYFKAKNSNSDLKNQAKNTLILNFGKETGDLIEKRIPAEEVAKDFKAFIGLQMVASREKELDEEYRASKK